jgi:hypothetical protein
MKKENRSFLETTDGWQALAYTILGYRCYRTENGAFRIDVSRRKNGQRKDRP